MAGWSRRAVAFDLEAARRMYRAGATLDAIARAQGVSRTTVFARLTAAGEPRRSQSEATALAWADQQRRAAASIRERARMAAQPDLMEPVEVPRWVPGGLVDDFIDHARLWGEEAAASHCRRLKREAEACL